MKRFAIVALPILAVLSVLGVALLVTQFHPFTLRGRPAPSEPETPEVPE